MEKLLKLKQTLMIMGLLFSLIFMFQMYWLMRHSHINRKFQKIEKYYHQLQVENQKILYDINKENSTLEKNEFSHLVKVNVKQIPIVEFN